MRIYRVLFACALFILLCGCSLAQNPFAPTLTRTRPPVTPTPAGTATPVPTSTETPTLTLTPTITPTFTPYPTRTSPYPVGLGTPLPDMGFPEITAGTVPSLTPVFSLLTQQIWQTAPSWDGKQLFAATSNGVVVYDTQGQVIADWPGIQTFDLPCVSCLAVNHDGSRFALMTRQGGKWQAQVYDVSANKPTLRVTRPLDVPFENLPNQVRLALSPNGQLLAYGAGAGESLVLNLDTGATPLSDQDQADSLAFTPDGNALVIRRGREMLFWNTATWKNPSNLLLPASDSPYAFSPDAKYIAVATATTIRVFEIATLTPVREIAIPPTSAVNRVWQLVFTDPTTLRGYGLQWDTPHTNAIVDLVEWNAETGKTLKTDETTTSNPPDVLSTLWGAVIPTPTPASDIEIGQYAKFRFIDLDTLLINGVHSACWVKLSIGENTCFTDPKYTVLASDGGAFREVLQAHDTLLQNWNNGGNVFDVQPYQISAVDRSGQFILLNVNNATTDIYYQPKKLPIGSLAGTLVNYAEAGNLMAIMVQQNPVVVSITLIDKTTRKTQYQKADSRILKPLAIAGDGRVYFLQQDPDQPQVILRVIAPKTNVVTDVARLTLPSDPQVMTRSSDGTLALGLSDGTVVVVSPDGQQVGSFQAAFSPVAGISFTLDGRYLAVASAEGIRIFAVLP